MITFIYTIHKDFVNVYPLYKYMKDKGYDVKIQHIWKDRPNKITTKYVYSAYSEPRELIQNAGFKGIHIAGEHGAAPYKTYTYMHSYKADKNDINKEVDLYIAPSKTWIDNMYSHNPDIKAKVELGGLLRFYDINNIKIDRIKEAKRLHLNPNKPIILFAPSWGAATNKDWGVNNILKIGKLDNMFTFLHGSAPSSTINKLNLAPVDRQIPTTNITEEKLLNLIGNPNKYLLLADIIITDISSVGIEFGYLNKPVINMEYPSYPDTDRNAVYIRNGFYYIKALDKEIKIGKVVKPENVKERINEILTKGDDMKEDRQSMYPDMLYQPKDTLKHFCDIIISTFPDIKK